MSIFLRVLALLAAMASISFADEGYKYGLAEYSDYGGTRVECFMVGRDGKPNPKYGPSDPEKCRDEVHPALKPIEMRGTRQVVVCELQDSKGRAVGTDARYFHRTAIPGGRHDECRQLFGANAHYERVLSAGGKSYQCTFVTGDGAIVYEHQSIPSDRCGELKPHHYEWVGLNSRFDAYCAAVDENGIEYEKSSDATRCSVTFKVVQKDSALSCVAYRPDDSAISQDFPPARCGIEIVGHRLSYADFKYGRGKSVRQENCYASDASGNLYNPPVGSHRCRDNPAPEQMTTVVERTQALSPSLFLKKMDESDWPRAEKPKTKSRK